LKGSGLPEPFVSQKIDCANAAQLSFTPRVSISGWIQMQAARELVTKLVERAMIPLNIGLGFTGAFIAMLATVIGLIRGE
jgi:hypothetical protein